MGGVMVQTPFHLTIAVKLLHPKGCRPKLITEVMLPPDSETRRVAGRPRFGLPGSSHLYSVDYAVVPLSSLTFPGSEVKSGVPLTFFLRKLGPSFHSMYLSVGHEDRNP